jgi:hypothetical protein
METFKKIFSLEMQKKVERKIFKNSGKNWKKFHWKLRLKIERNPLKTEVKIERKFIENWGKNRKKIDRKLG